MTTASLHRDPGDVQLPMTDEQPRHRGPWRTAFVLSAILGWSALVAFGVMAMTGEMFAAVTLLTASASAFAAAGVAATFVPCPFIPEGAGRCQAGFRPAVSRRRGCLQA